MALDGKYLARAREKLEQRRAANMQEQQRRETDAYARVPGSATPCWYVPALCWVAGPCRLSPTKPSWSST